ncbi:hypothetical protein Bhyg_08105 [Pseudolycoriella hygida]|uniref:Uncharacterized protein n=1 Tax=Pseudolycoriella hygida TaxID=35572 RepID=A0A9Q0N5S8_9DIPT|nr:hypothetical protein Bhyg_08105 [Pseudolycoriella hygida]
MDGYFYKKWCKSKSKSEDEFVQKFAIWTNLVLNLPTLTVSLNGAEDLEIDQLLQATSEAAENLNASDLETLLKLLRSDKNEAKKIVDMLEASK